MRRNRKALAQEGQVSFLMAHDEATLQQASEALIHLQRQHWTEQGKPRVFLREKFLSFHKGLSALALANQWLQLYVLSLDHTPIAAIYNFKYNNKIYFYQSGTIPHHKKEFSKTISPGFILHSFCIEAAITEGAVEYDFMRGNSVYEKKWERQLRHLVSIRILPVGFRLWNIVWAIQGR
jgi:CelD/BcsL family acetyltransferase involved in cellulose biosynthesis